MRSESLIHDAAWSASLSVTQVVAHLLKEEDQRAVLEAIYDRIKAALVHYEDRADRMRRRVTPSSN